MDERWRLSRRQVLKRMFAAGALTPRVRPGGRAVRLPAPVPGATPVRFSSASEPKRNALVSRSCSASTRRRRTSRRA